MTPGRSGTEARIRPSASRSISTRIGWISTIDTSILPERVSIETAESSAQSERRAAGVTENLSPDCWSDGDLATGIVRLWPALGAMDYVGDFYRIGQCPVHDDEGQRWEWQFPCTFHAALSATMREGLESASALINLSGSTVRGGGIVLTNVGNDGGEIFSGLRGPANLHFTNETSVRYSILPLRA